MCDDPTDGCEPPWRQPRRPPSRTYADETQVGVEDAVHPMPRICTWNLWCHTVQRPRVARDTDDPLVHRRDILDIDDMPPHPIAWIPVDSDPRPRDEVCGNIESPDIERTVEKPVTDTHTHPLAVRIRTPVTKNTPAYLACQGYISHISVPFGHIVATIRCDI